MRLATIAWRGLLARPLRTALAVIGVALGVAVVAATVITTASSDAALRSATADLLGAADVRLRAFAETGFTPRAVQALRAMPEITVAAPVSERRLIVHTDPGEDEKVFSLLAIGIDPAIDASLREPRLTAGVPLSTDSPTDALVAASWAARNGLELGTSFGSMDGARGCHRCASSGSWRTPDSPRSSVARCSSCRATTLDESFLVPGADPIRGSRRR